MNFLDPFTTGHACFTIIYEVVLYRMAEPPLSAWASMAHRTSICTRIFSLRNFDKTFSSSLAAFFFSGKKLSVQKV